MGRRGAVEKRREKKQEGTAERDTHTEAPGQKRGCSRPGGWSERGQRSERPLGLRSSHGTVLHIHVLPWFHQ